MSRVMTANQLVAQLKKWRVPYRGTIGWRRRNRAGHGAFGDMLGVLNHHTAGAKGSSARSELRVLKRGRRDLPGPLCHMSPARGGVVWLVGNGRANHAGAVRHQVLDAFLKKHVVHRPDTTDGETKDANAFLYGVEVQNNGRGERYPDVQLLSLVLLNAAICDFHGWGPNASAQHYEITRRKVDMADIRGEAAGTWLRREVAVALRAGPGKYVTLGWRPPKPPDPGYVAKAGDTWASIAKAHHVGLWRLYRANHPVRPPTAGDLITLPKETR